MYAWVIGVDEVGRGPLAGPVMVGVVAVPADFDWVRLPGVTDSKKLSEKKREAIYEKAKELQSAGKLFFAVAGESAAVIDELGIVLAIKQATVQGLAEVQSAAKLLPDEVRVLLDGGLVAPPEYVHQETIVKGDAKESVIGLASVVAKVMRDRLMVEMEAEYPGYGLSVHKGYGTAAHCAAVRRLGLSTIHRVSFCRNLAK